MLNPKRFLNLLIGLLIPLPALALDAVKLADGVHAFIARDAKPSARNGGFVANGGFLVGESGVVLINPGPNREGGRLREAAVAKITSLPIVLVIDTHARPEQVLGTGYFVARGVPVLATADTVRLMGERCEQCLGYLSEQVGKTAMAGTEIVLPKDGLRHGQPIGIAGRRIRVISPEKAMMPGNAAVFDFGSRVLFSGVLLSLDTLPDLREADPAGLLEALANLEQLPIRLVVPDQGPPSPASRIEEFRRYVSALSERVGAAYRKGVTLSEVAESVDMPEFAPWRGYPEQHLVNARALYKRLEKLDFEGSRSQ